MLSSPWFWFAVGAFAWRLFAPVIARHMAERTLYRDKREDLHLAVGCGVMVAFAVLVWVVAEWLSS